MYHFLCSNNTFRENILKVIYVILLYDLWKTNRLKCSNCRFRKRNSDLDLYEVNVKMKVIT